LSRRQIPVSCNLDCGGGCPLIATLEGGRVIAITDNPLRDSHMTGCVKGFQMHRVLYSEDRLRRPLIRNGPRGSGEFREASWDEALDLVAGGLAKVKTRHGAASILHLGGSGSNRGSLHNTLRLTKRFLAMFGGYTERYSSYSVGAAAFVTPYVLGTFEAGIDSGSLRGSKMIILWGANVSDLKLECGLEVHLREAKERGVEIVVIDPRRTLTVKTLATRWIPIYPGTDSAMMIAVLHTLITEGLVDRTFIEKYSHGFEVLESYILGGVDGEPKTPDWAEGICGVPSKVIRELAERYGSTHPTALIPGASIQRTIGGEEAIRMGVTLQTATGNLGASGGSSGALAIGTLPRLRVGQIGVPRNPSGASIPVYRWADAILEGKRGDYPTDIKAIYNVGGNYLTQGSDTKKAVRAFQQVEFSVCHDRFLTPTAKYCDIILPATTFLERNDIVTPNGGNYLLFSNRVTQPIGESRNDYDIFCGLAERLGFGKEFSEGRDEEAWLRFFAADSDVKDYEGFRRTGIFSGGGLPRVAFFDFVGDPANHPLGTPSGKIHLFSENYAATGASPFPKLVYLKTNEEYPLRLVSPKSRFRVHSQNANIPWFREREMHRLWIHPDDAAIRGLRGGDEVSVSSSEGRLVVSVQVTEDIMRGVVCLHEGIWPELDSAGVDRVGAVNVLTSTEPTRPSQASRTHSVIVQVTRTSA
jgi:anaerobic dimethyl sulfoxide reductase subunit A